MRLSAETIKQYCTTSVIEAWCLQYNQHLGKTLLLPVEEPKSILDQVISDTIMRKLPEISDRFILNLVLFFCNFRYFRHKIPGSSSNYQVIKCGASGHNIRSRPSLKAPPVGMLVLGNRIGVIDYAVNPDGYWVLLDKTTAEKYCFNTDHEAWSLAIGPNNVLYLGNVTDKDSCPQVSIEAERVSKKGFDFSYNLPEASFSFGNQSVQSVTPKETISTNPFVFGDSVKSESPKLPKRERKEGKLSSLPKWFKGDDGKV